VWRHGGCAHRCEVVEMCALVRRGVLRCQLQARCAVGGGGAISMTVVTGSQWRLIDIE